jgi:ArsR family transcriptional regulator, cadmium/lead-responsive transcriptional repressor
VTPDAGAHVSTTAPQKKPAVGAVFTALSDPTRRRVVELLSQQPSVTASGLAQELPITRQAIAKHLTTLVDAGLVCAAHEGRETHYRLTPEPLAGAMQWMASAGARWDGRLARLADRLGDQPSTSARGEP